MGYTYTIKEKKTGYQEKLFLLQMENLFRQDKTESTIQTLLNLYVTTDEDEFKSHLRSNLNLVTVGNLGQLDKIVWSGQEKEIPFTFLHAISQVLVEILKNHGGQGLENRLTQCFHSGCMLSNGKMKIDEARDNFIKQFENNEESRALFLVVDNLSEILVHEDSRLSYALQRLNSHALKTFFASDIYLQGRIDYTLARIYKAGGENRRALRRADRAVRNFENAGALKNLARAMSLKGNIYRWLGNTRKGLECLESGLTTCRRAKDLKLEAMILGNLGLLYYDISEFQKAKTRYRQAVEIFRKIKDRQGQSKCLLYMGNIYWNRGDYKKAFGYHKRALSLFKDVKKSQEKAAILGTLGLDYWQFCSFSKALKCQKLALKLNRSMGNASGEVTNLINVGYIYSELGEYRRSLQHLVEAKRINRRLGNRKGQAWVTFLMGRVFRLLSEKERTMDCLEKALKIFREVNFASGELQVLGMIGVIKKEDGNFEQAFQYFETAYHLAETLKDEEEAAENLLRIGDICLNLKQTNNARAYLERASGLYENLQGMRGRAGCFESLAMLSNEQGNPDKAVRLLEKALEIDQISRNLEGEVQRRGKLASILYSTGDYEKSCLNFRAAVNIVDKFYPFLVADELKKSFFDRWQHIYEEFILFLLSMKMNNSDFLSTITSPECEAFEMLEKIRCKSLMQGFTDREWKRKDSNPDALQRKKMYMENEMRGLYDALLKEHSGSISNQNKIKILESRLKSVRIKHEEIMEELNMKVPVKGLTLGSRKSLSAADVQKYVLSDSTTALIEYFLSDNHSYAWLVTKEKVDVIALGDIKKCVGAKVDEIYKTMDHAENPLIMESFSQGVLNELYELVMQPVVEVLPDEVENLYLVPDSDLFRLPLALLLGGSYVISYAPVSALLDARIRKHAGQNAGTGEALVFGDPVDRGAEGDTSKQVESGKAGSLRFGRIAHSGDEARLVSKLLMPARLFTGTEATLRAFRENARDARVIHLATHGMTDRVNPQYSGILFSGDDKNHGGNFLHAFEISEMRIQAGLVVLSGCSTGRGKLSNSEGILGLARAFLLSGAQAVLVTLWNVSDESSHIFMEEFYKCYAVENHNASRAVLKAQAELRKSRFNHPYFWAPYVLYGSA